MEKEDGKYLEYLVQLIEKSIAPNSIVEHNVWLPIRNSKEGRKTQCDIVITTGDKPRQTITIVEVQDRRSKVNINDFRGWQKKLEDVGAQHLICVSRHEFTKSIKEQASLAGNRIRLVTLKELTADQIPLNFFSAIFTYENFNIVSYRPRIALLQSKGQENGITAEILERNKLTDSNKKLISIEGKAPISLYQLCKMNFEIPKHEKNGVAKLRFDIRKGERLHYLIGIVLLPISFLEVEFDWTFEKIDMPVSVLSYEQNEFGAIAWALVISQETPNGKIEFKIPVVKADEGYNISNMLFNAPLGLELELNIKVSKENI